MMLESVGIQADIANNGKEGVMLFEQNPQRYDMVLMDLQMPVMSGYDAAMAIRKQDTVIPIIALTAAAMIEDKEKVKAAGMNEHIAKPIEKEELYSTLLEYVPHHKQNKQEAASKVSQKWQKPIDEVLQEQILTLQKRLQEGEMVDEEVQEVFAQQLKGYISSDALAAWREALEDYEYDKAVAQMQEWHSKEDESTK